MTDHAHTLSILQRARHFPGYNAFIGQKSLSVLSTPNIQYVVIMIILVILLPHLPKTLNFFLLLPLTFLLQHFLQEIFLWMCKKTALITWSTSWWETPTLLMKYHLPPIHLLEVHASDHLQPLCTKLNNSSFMLKPPTKSLLGQGNGAYTESRCPEQEEEL